MACRSMRQAEVETALMRGITCQGCWQLAVVRYVGLELELSSGLQILQMGRDDRASGCLFRLRTPEEEEIQNEITNMQNHWTCLRGRALRRLAAMRRCSERLPCQACRPTTRVIDKRKRVRQTMTAKASELYLVARHKQQASEARERERH
jgi:hypothetical protein